MLGLQEDAEVFAFLLEFLYTDRLERLPQHLLRAGGAALLLDAADRYLVTNLKVRLPGPGLRVPSSLQPGGQLASQPWMAMLEHLRDFCMVSREHAEWCALLLVAADHRLVPKLKAAGLQSVALQAATHTSS